MCNQQELDYFYEILLNLNLISLPIVLKHLFM